MRRWFPKQVLIILSVCLTALFVGYLLVPDKEEVAFTYFQGGETSKAYKTYLELSKDKDYDMSVVAPLSDLYEDYGKMDKSVAILKKFLEKHPQSIEVRRELQHLYFDLGYFDHYLKMTEEIYKLQPNEKEIRTIIHLCGYTQNYSKKKRYLKELVLKYNPTSNEVVEAMTLFASNDQIDQALLLFNHYYQKKKKKTSVQSVYLAFNLLLDTKANKQAFDLVNHYCDLCNCSKKVVDFVILLNKKDFFAEGYLLLNRFFPSMKQKADFQQAYISQLYLIGKKEKAYAMMERFWKENILAKPLLKDFALSLLDRNERKKAFIVLSNLPKEEADLDFLDSLILYSLQKNDKQVAEIALHLIKEENFNLSFFQKISLDLALEEYAQVKTSLKHLQKIQNPYQKVLLAFYLSQKGFDSYAENLVFSLQSLDGVDPSYFRKVAEIYVALAQEKLGYTLLARFNGDKNDQNYLFAKAMLAARLGKEKDIQYWMKKSKRLSGEKLQTLYYLAKEKGNKGLAFYVAKEGYKKNKNNKEISLIYADALIDKGSYEQALAALENLNKDDPKVFNAYLAASIAIAKDDPQKLNVLKSLVKERIRTLTDEQKRDIGYLYTKYNLFEDAEAIFLSLAEKENALNKDVDQLVYIWSKDKRLAKVDFLLQRAEEAKKEDKIIWAKYLFNLGFYKETLTLLKNPNLKDEKVAKVYLDALIATKNESLLHQAIEEILSFNLPWQKIKDIADLSYEAGLNQLAKKGYQKVIAIKKEKQSLERLGIISYFLGEYTQAIAFFNEYEQTFGGSYRTFYYTGLWYLQKKEHTVSRFYFKKAYALLYGQNVLDKQEKLEQRKILAYLLRRLGYEKQAVNIFSQIAKDNQSNPYIQAEYAQFLMDLKCLEEAKNILYRVCYEY